MSIYSDYKCGAISYEEMRSAAYWEYCRDQAIEELESMKMYAEDEFDTTIKNFLEEDYGLDACIEYSLSDDLYTVVYDMNNNYEILITVDSTYAEDVLDAIAYIEENGKLCFPNIYKDYKLYKKFMEILTETLKDKQFKQRWINEEGFAEKFYEDTIKTINIA